METVSQGYPLFVVSWRELGDKRSDPDLEMVVYWEDGLPRTVSIPPSRSESPHAADSLEVDELDVSWLCYSGRKIEFFSTVDEARSFISSTSWNAV